MLKGLLELVGLGFEHLCMTIIDAGSGYYNLKLHKKSYQTTFEHQFGRYRSTKLPFAVVPVGNMFHQNINKILEDLPNAFGITDNILVIGYDADGREKTRIWTSIVIY